MHESEPTSMTDAHHDGSERYVSDPNPELGDTVTTFVRVPPGRRVDEVAARVVVDAEPWVIEAELDRCDDDGVQWWRADLPIGNPVTNYRFHLREGGTTSWLNAAGEHTWDVPDAGDFRLSTEHRPPSWVHETVWYQIFPDRFSRGPDDDFAAELPEWANARAWDEPIRTDLDLAMFDLHGGSIDGITRRLDHLVDLGINGIYTCPFFPARSNHRYDASAFDHVDPLLGGDDALRRLTAAAAERDIRVMGDLTTNHSGAHHDWYRTAQADPSSPERGYYLHDEAGAPIFWKGVPSLPKFDHDSEAFRRHLYEGPDSIAGRFLSDEFGLAAMRIDVANMTGRYREIDHNLRCSTALRRTIDEVRPDGWLLGEHGHDATADLHGAGWHGTMNYAGFTRPLWTWLRRDDGSPVTAFGDSGPLPRRRGVDVARSARAFLSQIPYSVQLTGMNLLGSHDSARWAQATGDDTRNLVGLAALMGWPGTPSIFYGDEIGLASDATWDVTARAVMPWHAPDAWNRDLLTAYTELVSFRRTRAALARGGMRWLSIGDDHLTWIRESATDAVLVHVARGAHGPIVLDGVRPTARVGRGIELAETEASLTLSATGPGFVLVDVV